MYQPCGIYNVLNFATSLTQTWEPNNMAKAATNLAALQQAITPAQTQVVEMWGLEPQTLYMQSRCSTS
jgi:hypothetical protein